MGEVRVPAHANWGAQTQRAVENFPISGRPIDPKLIRALGLIKAEAAVVNAGRRDVPAVTRTLGDAIAAAALEVADGRHDREFPVDVFQTGSGTSSNMNANEVIARLAADALGEPGSVHPNDHVNASQSSNDVFPSAIQLAATEGIQVQLLPALGHLARVLRRRRGQRPRGEGRAHPLMDAVPITLGQELGGTPPRWSSPGPLGRRAHQVGRAPARRHRGGHRHQRPKGSGARSSDGLAAHRPAAHRGRDRVAAQARPTRSWRRRPSCAVPPWPW